MAFPIAEGAGFSSPEEISEALAKPSFGKYFSDHSALARWSPEKGWHDRALIGRESLQLHPGTAALHYGQEIFEGLKAFRHADDSVWIFRPEMNAARFAASARRMAMAPLPEQDFLDSVLELVSADKAWVPNGDGERSLYLRPFMFASETLIGVRAAAEYTYMVIATPASPFYPEPLKLWVTPDYSRTASGGTGMAKCGGNYAASMAAEAQAHENGCGQVLWLDSATRTNIEEGGTMNFFVVTKDDELVTPALDGNILAGVTRDSLLKLAEFHDLKPVERELALAEVCEQISSGQITEAFACGTAAVVSPVIGLKAPDFEVSVGDGKPGEKTMALREHLTGIQLGKREDTFGWLTPVA